MAANPDPYTGPPRDTIKLGYIDPLSGAFVQERWTPVCSISNLPSTIYATLEGCALGKKFEVVSYDDKLQPAEALIALNSLIDQNCPSSTPNVPG